MIPPPMLMESRDERVRQLIRLGAPSGRSRHRRRHSPLRLVAGRLLVRLGEALIQTRPEPVCAR